MNKVIILGYTFTIKEEYPEVPEQMTVYVWNKGEYYKAYCFMNDDIPGIGLGSKITAISDSIYFAIADINDDLVNKEIQDKIDQELFNKIK
jgi:hypothetical protein